MIRHEHRIRLICDSYRGRVPDRNDRKYGLGGFDDGEALRRAIRCPAEWYIDGDNTLETEHALAQARQAGWTIVRREGTWHVRCPHHAGAKGKPIPRSEERFL